MLSGFELDSLIIRLLSNIIILVLRTSDGAILGASKFVGKKKQLIQSYCKIHYFSLVREITGQQ